MVTVDAEDILCLKRIAAMGGCKGPVHLSTQSLGKLLGISQQTTSRRLRLLETAHLVSRTTKSSGQFVLVTKTGEELLHREFSEYCKIFGQIGGRHVLTGNVVSGIGEGRYYMSIPHYQEKFTELCGFTPYPGTLNVKLNPQSVLVRKRIDTLEWITVPGFSDDHRTFGEAHCILCGIDNIPCAIVVPGRTHYPEDVIEIISGILLRKTLKLNDNDNIQVEIGYD
jgi:riboflavin kinase